METKASPRFVIEGTWSGYTSSQSRVVHRTVHGRADKRLREWAARTSAIHYTDGTALFLAVRDCKPREVVKRIFGYKELIESCAYYGVASVAALEDAQRLAKRAADLDTGRHDDGSNDIR